MTGPYPPPQYPDNTGGSPPPVSGPGYGPPPVSGPGYGPPSMSGPGYGPPSGGDWPDQAPPFTAQPQPFAPQPFGPPSFGPPPAKKSGRGLLIGLLVGGLVLLVLCGAGIFGAIWFVGRDEQPAQIDGLINYRETNPSALGQDHSETEVSYPMTPPAGGTHHPQWQNCMGDVYTEPLGNGHAVHSLEHGAVWVTYRPDLAKSEVDKLAQRVRGTEYTMLSPYPDQPSPVSLQAWGYQLRLDKADLEQINAFLDAYRVKAAPEPGAPCSNGRTEPGT